MKIIYTIFLLTYCLVTFSQNSAVIYQYNNTGQLTKSIQNNTETIYTYDELDNRIGKTTIYHQKYLSVSLFLEGAFNSTTEQMSTALVDQGMVPLTQPYNTSPWNYTGSETLSALPPDIVDWVLVELRHAASPELALPSTILSGWPKAFLLKNDGSVVSLDGVDEPAIGNPSISDNIYVVIYHRNHVGIISANALSLADSTYSYDFTTGINQAYGGSAGYKEIAPGIFGMVAGDGDADGSVYMSDRTVWRNSLGVVSSYEASDYDMDGNSFMSDRTLWRGNLGITNPVSQSVGIPLYKSQVPYK